MYNKAFGTLAGEGSRAVRSTDVYDLASLTKTTAMLLAVMKLYDEGRLSLTDYVSDYLPFLKGTDKEHITLNDLLLDELGPSLDPSVLSGCHRQGQLYRPLVQEPCRSPAHRPRGARHVGQSPLPLPFGAHFRRPDRFLHPAGGRQPLAGRLVQGRDDAQDSFGPSARQALPLQLRGLHPLAAGGRGLCRHAAGRVCRPRILSPDGLAPYRFPPAPLPVEGRHCSFVGRRLPAQGHPAGLCAR